MVMLASDSGVETTSSEEDFFSQPPWSRLPEPTRRRFGVRNLTGVLRSILFQKTSETLPTNLQQIQTRLAQVKDQLDKMPEPPDAVELPYQLREQVYVFEGNIRQLFTSYQDSATSSSRSKLIQLMQVFSNRISSDKPTMVIKTEVESDKLSKAERCQREGSVADPVNIESDSGSAPQATFKSLPQSPQKSRKRDSRVQRFRLEEIRELNQRHYQSSVPGEIEPAAVEEMHRMSVQYWGTTFKSFMLEVSRLIHAEVIGCVLNTFGRQKHLSLYAKVEEIAEDYLDKLVQTEWTYLDRLCDAKKKYPLTFDTVGIKNAEMESLTQRREKRAEARLHIARAIQKHQNAGKKKVKEVCLEDLGPDPWDVEVQMAAKTRAYYDVASHRFVDGISQQIFAHLVLQCQEGLVSHIKTNLGLNDIPRNRARIVALMAEDTEREAYRARLISQLERLNEGHAYIASVLGAVNGPHLSRALSTPDESVYTDAIMSDDTTALPVMSSSNISSSKRKADVDHGGTSSESLTKRHQLRGSAASQEYTPLVDRSRSFEPEE